MYCDEQLSIRNFNNFLIEKKKVYASVDLEITNEFDIIYKLKIAFNQNNNKLIYHINICQEKK
ncbi:hypothetical protein BpHYR1_026120 [Brachionus plicatilis]|uniref:Uncharacterized protein n=1 Tax=Brachionus plicatilis TaxID=10195 RepID=A0A3M7T724_BRAPC|nr:hypothetical protein BpHYR1_026120 [Brachionus plicatilis]